MERLQKYMARCGVASRRKAEEMILAGLVKVNGETIRKLGVKIEPGKDRVEVKGKAIKPAEFIYLMLNKPQGYITGNRDPHGRLTVLDLLPVEFPRVFPVGRLDYNTTGLLLLTNDGQLAFGLTHPSFEVKKIYEALVKGVPEASSLDCLRKGILLEDGPTLPAKVDIIKVESGNAITRIVIREGRKRQVRRMFRAIGYPVIELTRVGIGPLTLDGLQLGKYRPLTGKEIAELKKLLN